MKDTDTEKTTPRAAGRPAARPIVGESGNRIQWSARHDWNTVLRLRYAAFKMGVTVTQAATMGSLLLIEDFFRAHPEQRGDFAQYMQQHADDWKQERGKDITKVVKL